MSLLKLNKVLINSYGVWIRTITSQASQRRLELAPMKDRYGTIRGPYTALNAKHIQFFSDTLGANRVLLSSDADLERYNVDLFNQFKGNCSIVLKPKTTKEVSKILAYCNDNLLAVCPQGGNTGVCGGAIPVFDEVLISAELLNKVLNVDEISGIVVCESGCILENLNKHLLDTNLMVPLDIGSKGSCQIGGNVSTNAGGFRFARFGSLHNNVLGLEVVKANGDVLDCLRSLRKDNTGYHLKNMFIGAEGTLGFITKVALQCVTAPKAINVAFLGIESYEKVLTTYLHAKHELGEILSAAEFIDDESARMCAEELNLHPPTGNYPCYLLIETYGSNKDHDSEKVNNFLESCLENGYVKNGTCSSDPSKCQAIWRFRESLSLIGSTNYYAFCYDFTLPLKHYYTIVEIIKKHMGEKAVSVMGFGHLGDGNIHMHILVPKYSKTVHQYIEPYIYQKVLELNGSISAEHGLGFKNARHLHLCRSRTYIEAMKNIKTAMDPNGILNPYKVIQTVF